MPATPEAVPGQPRSRAEAAARPADAWQRQGGQGTRGRREPARAAAGAPAAGARADKPGLHREREAREPRCLQQGCQGRPPVWTPWHRQQKRSAAQGQRDSRPWKELASRFPSETPLSVPLGSCGPGLCARGSHRWPPRLQHHWGASTLPQVPYPLAAHGLLQAEATDMGWPRDTDSLLPFVSLLEWDCPQTGKGQQMLSREEVWLPEGRQPCEFHPRAERSTQVQ